MLVSRQYMLDWIDVFNYGEQNAISEAGALAVQETFILS